MPNTASAKKALRQAKKRTALNLTKKKKISELLKATLKAMKAKSAEAPELARKTVQALDKAAKTNTIHINKANRLKSRLQNKLSQITKNS